MSSQPATNEWLQKDGAMFNTITGTVLWRDANNIWMVYRGGAVLHLRNSIEEIEVVWEQCLQTIKK